VSLRLLALDTTSEYGSIALVEGAELIELAKGAALIEEVALHSPEGFAHIVFDEIQNLLERHRLKLRDLDGFASASGPGSFTGVRVGLTAVKGLAEACGRRVVAVSNLQALAWFGTRPLRAPVLDARRGEIYGAVYDSELHPLCPEVVVHFNQWITTLPPGDLEVVTSGFEVPSQGRFPVTLAPRALACAVASIAAVRFALGRANDPAEIDANYVRRSDAELLWRGPS
jgi:tRNA threonylcarbamoyladenosine biosynthesis protein TsaB